MTEFVDGLNVGDLATLVQCLGVRFNEDFAKWSDVASQDKKDVTLSIASSFVGMMSGGDHGLLQAMVSRGHTGVRAADDDKIGVGEVSHLADDNVRVVDSEDELQEEDMADDDSSGERDESAIDPYALSSSGSVHIRGAILLDESRFAHLFRAIGQGVINEWCMSTPVKQDWTERSHHIRLADLDTGWMCISGDVPLVYGCTVHKYRKINDQSSRGRGAQPKLKKPVQAGQLRQYLYRTVESLWWAKRVTIISKGFPSRLAWMGYTVDVCK